MLRKWTGNVVDLSTTAYAIFRQDGFAALINSIKSYMINKRLSTIYLYVKYRHSPNKTTHTIEGLPVTVPLEQWWQFQRFYRVHNERELLEDLIKELKDDDVIYDIGAFLGWHSLVSAAAVSNSKGKVIAFEPHPESYMKLTEVLQFAKSNVIAYPVAISDRCKFVEVDRRCSSETNIIEEDRKSTGLHVFALHGDALLEREGVPAPNVLKIDVEGAELEVLRGCNELIKHSSVRIIYCEIHPDKSPNGDQTLEKVTEIFASHEFEYEQISSMGKSIIKGVRK